MIHALTVSMVLAGTVADSTQSQVNAAAVPEDAHGNRAEIHHAQRGDPVRPQPVPVSGAADWYALGPFGGDVQDVAASLVDPNIVLAGIAPGGSVGGALYRSTDGGQSWSEVTQLSGNSVYSIAFAPDGVVFIGTMQGVWRSNGHGASGTWTELNLNIGINRQTFAVTIDPNNPNVIYAGIADAIGNQSNNLIRSADGGQTWSNITPPLDSPISGRGVAVDPNNSSNIMAVFGGGFGGGQVWFSSSAGAAGSWVNRTAGLPGNPMTDVIHDGTRYIVAGGLQFGSQHVGVFATSNNGATWTALHNASWPSLVVTDLSLAPNDPQILLAATAHGINRSTDGGATWTLTVGGTGNLALNAVRFAPGSSSLAFAGANGLGVMLSEDGGASFAQSSVGIGALNVYSVASNPNDANDMAIAFQGLNSGGVYSSIDGGETWTLEDSLPATRYNTVRYAPDGRLHAISDGPTSIGQEAVYRREHDGTWTYLGPNQGPAFEARLWALAFSENDPDLMFVAGQDFGSIYGFDATIWRSTTSGASWDKVYESGVNNQTVRSVQIVADGADQTMVAAFEDTSAAQAGGVLRSINGGETWNPAMIGLPVGTQGMSLTALSGQPQTLFLASRSLSVGGVFRSDNGGISWSQAGFNPGASGIVADPADNQVIYLMPTSGTTRVFRSLDQAASFSAFDDGLGNPGARRDMFHTGGNSPRLLLATGTGVYATDIEGPCAPADLNCDGVVDVSDLLLLLGAWGACPPGDCPADLNGDGAVDVSDLLILLGAWG